MIARTLLLIALVVPSLSTLAADANPPTVAGKAEYAGYVLSIDTDAPGSKQLIEGNYAEAIRTAKRSLQVSNNLSAWLTLCATYIGTSDLRNAKHACDAAIDAADAPRTTARLPHGHRDREGLAKAYSNRAILAMLLGDSTAAGADLKVAAQQNRHMDVIQQNLSIVNREAVLAKQNLFNVE